MKALFFLLLPATALSQTASGGAYVPADLAERIEGNTHSAIDLALTPWLAFDATSTAVTVRVRGRWFDGAFRIREDHLELQTAADTWRRHTWSDLGNGDVLTDALAGTASTERLRWIPGSPPELEREWTRRWTAAQLLRLSGLFGAPGKSMRVTTAGVVLDGARLSVIALSCLDRCGGPRRLVCLRNASRGIILVEKDGALIDLTQGTGRRADFTEHDGTPLEDSPGLDCPPILTVLDAWHPASRLWRKGGAPEISGDLRTTQAPSTAAAESALRARMADLHRCNPTGEEIEATFQLWVPSSGLPSRVAVEAPRAARPCLGAIAWDLTLPPGVEASRAGPLKVTLRIPP